jgi:hypothetical protein
MDLVQKMANLAKREGQVTTDPADPSPNLTWRRKTQPTRTIVEEAAKEKIDGGERRPRLGHQINS